MESSSDEEYDETPQILDQQEDISRFMQNYDPKMSPMISRVPVYPMYGGVTKNVLRHVFVDLY